jgi:hypothetical protein
MRTLKMKLIVLSLVIGLAIGGGSAVVAKADSLAYGPDTCRNGFVWREAAIHDHVCVRPASRTTAQRENGLAFSRVDPAGAYGPFTCINGFVWREAFPGDAVCVTPSRRSAVAVENANARRNRVLG